MLWSGLIVGLLLPLLPHQAAAAAVTTCGVRDVETAPLRSSTGFTAVLTMHGDDDHGKNTHLCEAAYSLQITTPEKMPRQPFHWTSSIGDWDRPIAFRVEGFSSDGRHVFLSILEDKYPGAVEAVDYDMLAGALVSDVSLDSHFTRRLSRACAATLHLVGVSPAGWMVLGTSRRSGCAGTSLWQLGPNRTTGPAGGVVLPQYPRRLSSRSEREALDPGLIVLHEQSPQALPFAILLRACRAR